MPATTRYQVFLSSTFTDLKEERAEVIQALWELDCIPTGMEAFLASNISQWEIIKRVIDECDYYILIIGGRYGSLTSDGISYTEKEYDYAKKIGLPILAFVHAEPSEISIGKSEATQELRAKLDAFRKKVMDAHPIRTWKNAHELGALASRSLVQETKRNPRPGWVRNDGASPVELLQRIDALTQENIALKNERVKASDLPFDRNELSSGKDEVTLNGTMRYWHKGEQSWSGTNTDWRAQITWDTIFRNVGPSLIHETTEAQIHRALARFYKFASYDWRNIEADRASISSSSFSDVIIQLRALGLIEGGTKKRGINDKEKYWKLTPYGDTYLVGLRASRKGQTALSVLEEDEAEQDVN